MDNDQKKGMPKKLLIKVIIPLLIVVAIGALWIFKNSEANTDDTKTPNNTTQATQTTDANPDFALLVTSEIDLDKLKSYGVPIIIDFGADSCIPCKEMAPVLKALNEELRGKAIVRFVDVWKYPDLAKKFPISIIPTQIYFDASGKPYNPSNPEAMQMKQYSMKDTNELAFTTHEGGMTKEQLLEILKEMGMKE